MMSSAIPIGSRDGEHREDPDPPPDARRLELGIGLGPTSGAGGAAPEARSAARAAARTRRSPCRRCTTRGRRSAAVRRCPRAASGFRARRTRRAGARARRARRPRRGRRRVAARLARAARLSSPSSSPILRARARRPCEGAAPRVPRAAVDVAGACDTRAVHRWTHLRGGRRRPREPEASERLAAPARRVRSAVDCRSRSTSCDGSSSTRGPTAPARPTRTATR